ncbi:MAG: tRNA (adenosine(37)-N6)-threonylcarbamoyltransferase complex dimerization subunit type 1 TsaB [Clostridia bacterium]
MKILLINSVADKLTVAVYKDGELFSENAADKLKSHSSEINGSIRNIMQKAEIKFDELDAYACCVGPGSFTGIRVGIATIKGFMTAVEKKLISVDSFEILAYTVNTETELIMDAGRERVYFSICDKNKVLTQPIMINNDEIPYGKPVVKYDVKADYSQAFALAAINKYIKNEFVTHLSPLYIQLCQAEEEYNNKNNAKLEK